MDYRREIDGLRAVAILPVVLFHTGLGAFRHGLHGVDVFFVISGFLITRLILEELARGVFTLRGFYERRARRILPALLAVCGVSIGAAFLLMPPFLMREFAQSLGAVATFTSNAYFLHNSDYFATAAEYKPLLHTWSLAVEEQFYLLFPLFLLLTRSWRSGLALGLLAVLAALSYWATEVLSNHRASALFYLLPSRAWELAAGAGAAYLAFHRTLPGQALARQGLSLAGAVLVLWSLSPLGGVQPWPGPHAFAAVAGAVLLLLYATRDTLVGRLLSLPLPVGVGLISYSAYLWHQPLFAFYKIGVPTVPSPALLLALAGVTFPLAYLSWRYVETPCRQRDRVAFKPFATGALAASLVVFAIGVGGHFSGGYAFLLFSAAQNQTMTTTLPSPYRNACHLLRPQEFAHFPICTLPQGANAEWAVLGNSHGVELAYALGEALKSVKPAQAGVRQYTSSSCPPAYGAASKSLSSCKSWNQHAVESILGDPAIRYVVLSYKTHALGKEQPADILRGKVEALASMARDFIAAGKVVVYVRQAPLLPRHIQYLLREQDPVPDMLPGMRLEMWKQRYSEFNAQLAALPSGVIQIDPATTLCDALTCYAIQEGKGLYFDDHHMSVSGAARVAPDILHRVLGTPTQTRH